MHRFSALIVASLCLNVILTPSSAQAIWECMNIETGSTTFTDSPVPSSRIKCREYKASGNYSKSAAAAWSDSSDKATTSETSARAKTTQTKSSAARRSTPKSASEDLPAKIKKSASSMSREQRREAAKERFDEQLKRNQER